MLSKFSSKIGRGTAYYCKMVCLRMRARSVHLCSFSSFVDFFYPATERGGRPGTTKGSQCYRGKMAKYGSLSTKTAGLEAWNVATSK